MGETGAITVNEPASAATSLADAPGGFDRTWFLGTWGDAWSTLPMWNVSDPDLERCACAYHLGQERYASCTFVPSNHCYVLIPVRREDHIYRITW